MTDQSSNLQCLKLTGSDPYSWGLQHGEAFARQIRELAALRAQLLIRWTPGWSQEAVDRLCDDQLAALSERWPGMLAELKGLSAASGASLRQLIVLNAYTDLRDFSASEAPAVEGGCSVLSARGPGLGFSAQTWDMHASAEQYTLLLEIPGATVPVHVLTVAGCVGLAGVNDAGVSVMINTLHCRETNRAGLIWPGLVRLALSESTARSATQTLAANLPSSGHNYLIADASESINIETTGRRCEQTAAISQKSPGTIAHTNHYLGNLKTEEITSRLSPSTFQRLDAMHTFFRAHPPGDLAADTLQRGFFETGPLQQCVCLPAAADPHAGTTCGGIAVNHQTQKAFAFRGRYEPANCVEWEY